MKADLDPTENAAPLVGAGRFPGSVRTADLTSTHSTRPGLTAWAFVFLKEVNDV
jgi:hypothetical protein